jgi:hypothetical protein
MPAPQAMPSGHSLPPSPPSLPSPPSAAPRVEHARLLEERVTPSGGETLPVPQALELLKSGQFVNFCLGEGPAVPDGAAAGARERCAAEVLTVDEPAGELILARQSLPASLEAGTGCRVDFTAASGTYHLAGTVARLGSIEHPYVALHIHGATHVQLRRFVRVPVSIQPRRLQVVEAGGAFRELTGEIIDVSLGGLGLLVSEPLGAGVHLRVEFELPGRGGLITVQGRIVTPPGPAEAQVGADAPPAKRSSYRRGLEFDPLTVDDLRRLQRALYYRQVELRRLERPALAAGISAVAGGTLARTGA